MRLSGLFLMAWWCVGWSGGAVIRAGPQENNSTAPTMEVPGRTQCLLTHKSIIAPTVLHPVTEVLVAPGDQVKKDQPLVKLDDDEPQADVRNKYAILENAKIASAEARRYLAQAEKSFQQGAIPEQRYHEARVGALKTEADERAAQAAHEAAKAELEHYVVVSLIDGVVSRLEVHPGMVSRPGTTNWGEVVDIRELDVRCSLTLAQADSVAVGQDVEVQSETEPPLRFAGKVIFISPVADAAAGTVPVLVRFSNPDSRLRANVGVRVRFRSTAPAAAR